MEITITIPDVLVSQAASNGLPADAYVEQLLGRTAAASVAQNRDREQIRTDLLADWEHYQKTGLHLEDDEVDGWLSRLENGEDVEPPMLHT
jgi:hypothetical protein